MSVVAISKEARRAIARFKNLSEWDVEDAAYRMLNLDDYDSDDEDFLPAQHQIWGKHDEDLDVTIVCRRVDEDDEFEDEDCRFAVVDVRKGNWKPSWLVG